MKFILSCIALATAVIFMMVCLYKHDEDESIIELDDDEYERKREELNRLQDKDINLDNED